MPAAKLDLSRERDAHIDERLRKDLIIWLSTVRPDGRPHIVPVWFLWDGEQFLIFSKRNNQKLRNLAQNPNTSLALETINQGDDVIIMEGVGELVSEPGLNTAMPAYAEKYAGKFREFGWTGESMSQEYSEAIRIRPTRFL